MTTHHDSYQAAVWGAKREGTRAYVARDTQGYYHDLKRPETPFTLVRGAIVWAIVRDETGGLRMLPQSDKF